MVVVVPDRERRLWALVVVAAAIAATASPILDVYRLAAGAQPDPDVIAHAARSLLVTAGAAGLLWGVVALLGRRRLGQSVVLARRLALAGVLCLGLGVALAAVGNPVERVRDEAHAFTRLSGGSSTTPRFLSGAGNRYDYWRIAVDEFEAKPLRGIGAGNFQRAYYAERATSENIRQPHSLELQTLAELGLGGGVALAVLLIAVFAGLGRVAVLGRRDPRYVGIAVAAGGMFLTWLVHTSVDWLHLLPGVTAAALAAAAVLLRLPGPGEASPRRGHRLAVVLAAAVALAGVLMVGRLALADRYRAEAAGHVGTNPARALADASTARGLNGQSVSVLYVRAAAYARMNRYREARASLLEAIHLEPHNFVTWALLGDLNVRHGDISAAKRAYGRAVELNPRDPSLRALAERPRSALGK
jgi:tetratricopeptide (TPR) repeat protein